MSAEPNKEADKGEKILRTLSGYPVPNYYTEENLKEFDVKKELGRPGEYPFTRGITEDMYRDKYWVMSQYAGFGTARESNERFKYLIANGQTGLNVAFDLPTQCGLDSDDPLAEGEVGRVGMAIDTLRDFEIAFDGIDLDRITVSLTVNGSAAILIAMYLAMAERRGFDVTKLRGDVEVLLPGSLPNDGKVIEDARSYE